MGADPIRVAVKAVGSFLARFTTPFPCQLHKFLDPHSFVLQCREKREIVQKIWRVVLRTYRRNAVFLWMALLYTAFVALPSGYAYFVKFLPQPICIFLKAWSNSNTTLEGAMSWC